MKDKSKLPGDKFIRNSAAGVIQVNREGINSKEALKKFFKDKTEKKNKSSGDPIQSQAQDVLGSLGPDGTKCSKRRQNRLKNQLKIAQGDVRRSSRIAKLPDSKTLKD